MVLREWFNFFNPNVVVRVHTSYLYSNKDKPHITHHHLKSMGAFINALAAEAPSVKLSAATSVAVHAKKDYVPTRSGFVALSKNEVESKRRSAYAYAF